MLQDNQDSRSVDANTYCIEVSSRSSTPVPSRKSNPPSRSNTPSPKLSGPVEMPKNQIGYSFQDNLQTPYTPTVNNGHIEDPLNANVYKKYGPVDVTELTESSANSNRMVATNQTLTDENEQRNADHARFIDNSKYVSRNRSLTNTPNVYINGRDTGINVLFSVDIPTKTSRLNVPKSNVQFPLSPKSKTASLKENRLATKTNDLEKSFIEQYDCDKKKAEDSKESEKPAKTTDRIKIAQEQKQIAPEVHHESIVETTPQTNCSSRSSEFSSTSSNDDRINLRDLAATRMGSSEIMNWLSNGETNRKEEESFKPASNLHPKVSIEKLGPNIANLGIINFEEILKEISSFHIKPITKHGLPENTYTLSRLTSSEFLTPKKPNLNRSISPTLSSDLNEKYQNDNMAAKDSSLKWISALNEDDDLISNFSFKKYRNIST